MQKSLLGSTFLGLQDHHMSLSCFETVLLQSWRFMLV